MEFFRNCFKVAINWSLRIKERLPKLKLIDISGEKSRNLSRYNLNRNGLRTLLPINWQNISRYLLLCLNEEFESFRQLAETFDNLSSNFITSDSNFHLRRLVSSDDRKKNRYRDCIFRPTPPLRRDRGLAAGTRKIGARSGRIYRRVDAHAHRDPNSRK